MSRLLANTLAVAASTQVITTASALALAGLAPLIGAELGIESSWIGYQVSLLYAAGMVSSAAAGTFIARFGAVQIELAVLILSGLGFVGLTFGRLDLILLATLLIGLGSGLNNPAASQLLGRVTRAPQRNFVFSLKQCGVPLGAIAASFVLPMVAQQWGWQAALLCGAAAAGLVSLWLVFTHMEKHSHGSEGADRMSLGADVMSLQAIIWRTAELRALAALGLLYSAMQLVMSAFTVISLVEGAGWSVPAAGLIASAMQISGAIGRLWWGTMANRLGGGLSTLGIIGLISGLCCLGLCWQAVLPFTAQFALYVLMGLSAIGWNGVFLAEVTRYSPPDKIGAFTGGVMVYTFIGVIIGPSTFASIYGALASYNMAFLFFSVTGFAGFALALFTLVSTRRQSRHQAAERVSVLPGE